MKRTLNLLSKISKKNRIHARRILVYCQSIDMCSALYAHFLYVLGDKSYYPSNAPKSSDNRLFGMYHSCTDEYNKQVILKGFSQPDGVVRLVFATMALGMGVDFKGSDYTIHYGAPRSLDDYFQESGRAGREGQQSVSRVYWKPPEAPLRQDLTNFRNKEVACVRRYLEESSNCRRHILLQYFDSVLTNNLEECNSKLCCDNCRSRSA